MMMLLLLLLLATASILVMTDNPKCMILSVIFLNNDTYGCF